MPRNAHFGRAYLYGTNLKLGLTMPEYNTLSEGIEALRKQGYTEDFNLMQDCLDCGAGKYRLLHTDFKIDKVYRYEGESNPDDEAALYAISSDKYGIRGILVNGYGTSSAGVTDEMLAKLERREPEA